MDFIGIRLCPVLYSGIYKFDPLIILLVWYISRIGTFPIFLMKKSIECSFLDLEYDISMSFSP